MRQLIVTIIAFNFIITPAAYGYIDPGTGSLILQVVMGAVFASFFAVKSFWNRAFMWVKSLKKRN